MEYPLIIDGEKCGRLNVTQEGLYTVFEAVAAREGELVRLSVYGGGRESYLGVMQPWSGGLYLRRRMSRRERAAMPPELEYAAPSGMIARSESVLYDEVDPNAQATPEGESAPTPQAREVTARKKAELAPADDDALVWFSRPDGSLTAFDGEKSLVALPAELRRAEPRAALREINGRTYMLFRY